MIRRVQGLPRRQRQIVFGLGFGGGLLFILLITVALLLLSLNTGGRDQSIALVEDVTVRQFATLPDDDAYPASLAVGPNGVVYTGSFLSGAIWSIALDGTVTELPGTRDSIGAVAGLTLAPDGTLYVVDQIDSSPVTLGGAIKQITAAGDITVFATIDDEQGFLLPDDIVLDSQGNVYVSDRGRAEVWRFTPAGVGEVWWAAPLSDSEVQAAPTGLAYDAVTDSIIITDSNLNTIHRVAVESGVVDLLYEHDNRDFVPGLDGVTVGDDGQIYVAALGQNGLAVLRDGDLVYLAGVFRGISDVAFFDNRVYATNFDSFSLVVGLVRPRLPFALDVVELAGE